MSAAVISLFNHKGGVSKTTTAFNLGWALAEKGHNVLLVDADPQCNLTGMALELSGQEDLQAFYTSNPESNLYDALHPAFGGQPTPIKAATPVKTGHKNLFLLAGHIKVATYEPELSMSHKLLGAMPVLANLPGAFGVLLRETASKIKASVVLVDMSPSIGALNQNIWFHSNYFIVPTSPDYFCLMAINSLGEVLPAWHQVAQSIRAQQAVATYHIPQQSPKFIGILSQRYRPRSGRPSASFQRWIDQIAERTKNFLVPELAKFGGTVSDVDFRAAVAAHEPYELAQIADFNSLIAQSQEHATPVFALSDGQLGSSGVVQETMRANRDTFRQAFDQLAESTIKLCNL